MAEVILKRRESGSRRETRDVQWESHGFVAGAVVEVETAAEDVLFPGGTAQFPSFALDRRVLVRRGLVRQNKGSWFYDPLADGCKALSRFLSLDWGRDDEIVRFCRDFGVPGAYDILTWPTVLHTRRYWAMEVYDAYRGPWGELSESDTQRLPTPDDLRDDLKTAEPVWWLKKQQDEIRLLLDVYQAWQQNQIGELRRVFGPVFAALPVLLQFPGDTPFVPPHAFTRVSLHSALGEGPLPGGQWPVDDLIRVPSDGALAIHLKSVDSTPYIHLPLCQDPYTASLPQRQLTPRECQAYARLLISRRISAHLQNVRRRITIPTDFSSRFEDRFRPAHEENRVLATWHFASLLEALYLRVLGIVTGQARLDRCPECSARFELPLVWPGRRKLYCEPRCSNRHRQRKHRHKLELQRRFHLTDREANGMVQPADDEGTTLEQAARKVIARRRKPKTSSKRPLRRT